MAWKHSNMESCELDSARPWQDTLHAHFQGIGIAERGLTKGSDAQSNTPLHVLRCCGQGVSWHSLSKGRFNTHEHLDKTGPAVVRVIFPPALMLFSLPFAS
jgi:hypothetical protein